MKRTIKKISGRVVYENKWLRVREDRVRYWDGSEGVYGLVDKESFSLVIPFDGERLVLVKQYRYPTDRWGWEFPMGSDVDEKGVDPEQLARAELEEEVGLRANKLTSLGRLHPVNGYSGQEFFVYYAEELSEGERRLEVGEAEMEVGRFTRDELEEMIKSGEIVDGPSVAAWGLYLVKVVG